MDHRDGDERNDAPRNFRWLCKSCNTRLGLAMARRGEGRRTRQYNPAIPEGWYVVLTSDGGTVVGKFRDEDELPGQIIAGPFDTRDEAFAAQKEFGRRPNPPATGAASLGEYVSALRILNGEIAGDFNKARQTIHNTPAARRSEFAREIWQRRRRGGSDSELVRMLTGG